MRQSPYHPTGRQFPPANNHPIRPTIHQQKSSHHHYHHQQHQQQPLGSRRNHLQPGRAATTTNFIIHLHSDPTTRPGADVISSLISQCSSSSSCSPDRVVFSNTLRGPVTVSLYFLEWAHTLSFITSLWGLRLSGAHSLGPKLQSNKLLPSDEDELDQRLKALFIDHLNKLIDGEEVRRWQEKLTQKCDELAEVTKLLKKKNQLAVHNELSERKKGMMAERDLIRKRVREFKAGIMSILGYIEGKKEEGEGLQVFVFDGKMEWERIHRIILREIRRLEDGLPIYANRQQILDKIRGGQACVWFLLE